MKQSLAGQWLLWHLQNEVEVLAMMICCVLCNIVTELSSVGRRRRRRRRLPMSEGAASQPEQLPAVDSAGSFLFLF